MLGGPSAGAVLGGIPAASSPAASVEERVIAGFCCCVATFGWHCRLPETLGIARFLQALER
jgi:hypothetical protein